MKFVYRVHAIQRMFERHISEEDVRYIVETGKTIESYPDDLPYPSRLISGWRRERHLHIVAADNVEENEIIIITAYVPDPDQWSSDFERRNP